MTWGWSPAGGWESYEAWKRWYVQEWGRVDPPSPRQPSVRLFGVYRLFSAPWGIQIEVDVATAEPAAVAAAVREVRWRARAFLTRHRECYAHSSDPAVYLQVNVEAGPSRHPSVAYGEMAAPPMVPRRSVGELVALALEDLGG